MLTELPTEWCVEATQDNWKILFNWADFIWPWNKSNKYVTCNKTHTSSLENSDYIEISLDDFKRLVLGINEQKELQYEIC